ncbi:M48 family metalloprotease [Hymenobacter sp. RP-2-7]|uniref:M48 family metalloprotease n=1 Tax=Hymenobacter polaris TaxID=2682546 RepID=A0A7Y0AFG2_9BACT|nr:M48 family metalloprotease [Hymenobacter polaris]NML66110.1 M48 family metalloprotease [Hymenobacter polaris]
MKTLLLLLLLALGLASTQAAPLPDTARTQPAFDVAAATQRYLDTLTPAQKARSDAYFEGGYWLALWQAVYAVGVAAVFLEAGLGRRVQWLVAGLPRRWLRTLAYLALYIVLAWALSLPLTIYQGFVREHQYGLATQGLGEWLREVLIELGLSVLGGSLLLLGVYAALRRTGRAGWLWATGIVVAGLVGAVALGPVLISPLFNSARPLPAGPVRDGILQLARANGVPATNVYLVDASRQSTRISANVSGLGSTIRVSLNDNLLRRCSPAEIQAVMGHELGHYVLHHIPKMLLAFAALIALGFWLMDWAFHALVARYGRRWGIGGGLADVAGLPLLAALLAVATLLATPLTNTIIRTQEQEADMFGLNAARQPAGFARVALKLSEYRKIDPAPWEEILFFDHPSGRTRVRSAMQWQAWEAPLP